ncbi:MAG: C40 family peptidase [Bacilli bacterium]|nr:C40 family peptidase [Bacilli bacterium]
MEKENWHYSIGNDLYYYDIKNSLNNPNKATCCSTYVSVCLYKSKIFSEEEMNSFNYNFAPYIYTFLILNDWAEIDDFNSLKPGDIVFETEDGYSVDHVQIYAGYRKWFNAGSMSAIERVNPYNIDLNYSKKRFFCAMRNPN